MTIRLISSILIYLVIVANSELPPSSDKRVFRPVNEIVVHIIKSNAKASQQEFRQIQKEHLWQKHIVPNPIEIRLCTIVKGLSNLKPFRIKIILNRILIKDETKNI